MLIESVGGNAEASRLAGVRSRNLIILAYAFSGLCSGIAGLMISSGIKGADGNNAGLWFELDAILAVVIGGTALAGGRYFLAGTLVGALLIQTLTTTIYSIGDPAGDDAALQGARRHARLPGPVARVPREGAPAAGAAASDRSPPGPRSGWRRPA